jgi:hypothetical protein
MLPTINELDASIPKGTTSKRRASNRQQTVITEKKYMYL